MDTMTYNSKHRFINDTVSCFYYDGGDMVYIATNPELSEDKPKTIVITRGDFDKIATALGYVKKD